VLSRFLFVLLFLLSVTVAAAQDLSYADFSWQDIGKGLNFTRLEVLDKQTPVECLEVVRIDPNLNSFRVFHGSPQRISKWQENTHAVVIFNGSYFTSQGQPCGALLMDGVVCGPLKNSAMRGMFVAEPRGVSPDLPRATILDLTATPVEVKKLPWSQGLMSFPLLLDSKGAIRVKNSELQSQRTVICTDRKGNILVCHTAGDYFTLYELAKFLKTTPLDIDTALNLDGGSKAQLLINTPQFNFASPSSLEQSARDLFDSEASGLPTVIGVFPRQE
jgi:uncharacterized protein YigE (DUF2233 family)